MSLMDDARAELDRRGVEWRKWTKPRSQVETQFEVKRKDGTSHFVTISVTKGSAETGPVHMKGYVKSVDLALDAALGRETCEMEYVGDYMSWHCKACDMMDMAPRDPKPRYCKWCGRKAAEG